jgi:hypothetical protein
VPPDVAADEERDRAAKWAALPLDVQAAEVVGIEAQLYPAVHQGGVHRVALAGQGDRGGAAHPAEDRRAERLAQRGRLHFLGRSADEETQQRDLAGLGVLPEVADLLGQARKRSFSSGKLAMPWASASRRKRSRI